MSTSLISYKYIYWLVLNAVLVSSQTTYRLVPHHVQQQRRGRRTLGRRTEAQQMGALYQGYGTHYVDLWCGSPPQRQTVIVDTGSGMTAFPCNECKECGVPDYHIDALFDQDASSTFSWNTCQYGCASDRAECSRDQCKVTVGYAEGSKWVALEAVDTCYIGGPHEEPLVTDRGSGNIDPYHASHFSFGLMFGCQNKLKGELFVEQLADGIMGMENRPESFWNQMYRAGKMGDKKQFALCFSHQPTPQREGTEAGAMTLGGVDTRLHKSPMVYTPGAFDGRDSFFSVKLRNILLRDGSAGESAKSNKQNPTEGVRRVPISVEDLNHHGVIVDSGTTDTYWNPRIHDAFAAAFEEISGRPHNHVRLSLTDEELNALPTIIFQVQATASDNEGLDPYNTVGLAGSIDPENPHDILLAFPPSHYMEYSPSSGKYTSRFYTEKKQRGAVLGANVMMGHDVMFDATYGRIGWAESDCDYTNLLAGAGYDFEITGELKQAPPTSPPPASMPPSTKDNSFTEKTTKDSELLDGWSCHSAASCQYPVSAAVVIAIFLGSWYCGCCGRWSRRPRKDKIMYSRVPFQEVELVSKV